MSQEKPTKEIKCESCGNTFLGEVTVAMLGIRPREWWPQECPTCIEQQRLEAEREHQEYLVQARPEERRLWRERSGVPGGLLNRTFANFEPGCQDKALKSCRKYAEGFKVEEPEGYRSLILYSLGRGAYAVR